MFEIQFILVTYSGNSMSSTATSFVAEETGATLQRVESKIKDSKVGFRIISTE